GDPRGRALTTAFPPPPSGRPHAELSAEQRFDERDALGGRDRLHQRARLVVALEPRTRRPFAPAWAVQFVAVRPLRRARHLLEPRLWALQGLCRPTRRHAGHCFGPGIPRRAVALPRRDERSDAGCPGAGVAALLAVLVVVRASPARGRGSP